MKIKPSLPSKISNSDFSLLHSIKSTEFLFNNPNSNNFPQTKRREYSKTVGKEEEDKEEKVKLNKSELSKNWSVEKYIKLRINENGVNQTVDIKRYEKDPLIEKERSKNTKNKGKESRERFH